MYCGIPIPEPQVRYRALDGAATAVMASNIIQFVIEIEWGRTISHKS